MQILSLPPPYYQLNSARGVLYLEIPDPASLSSSSVEGGDSPLLICVLCICCSYCSPTDICLLSPPLPPLGVRLKHFQLQLHLLSALHLSPLSQSHQTGAGVVPPPAVALAEVKDQEAILNMKRGAETYIERIENKRSNNRGPFDQIDSRFERIDSRFEQIDSRFEQIDSRFKQIDSRFDQIDSRFDKIDSHFERIDSRLVQIDRKLRTFELMLKNAAALTPNDDLFAVPTEAGDEPPFDRFTVMGLFSMTSADITLLENYYGMGHGGTLELRRKRILQRIGAIKLIG